MGGTTEHKAPRKAPLNRQPHDPKTPKRAVPEAALAASRNQQKSQSGQVKSAAGRFGPLQARQSIPARFLQLDDLRPAGSRLIEHGDPAHAGPPAQVPAAWRDNRPAACRRTAGREYGFINRIRALHNLYIATPINARNRRPMRK